MQPLVLGFDFRGLHYALSFDLSLGAIERMHQPGLLIHGREAIDRGADRHTDRLLSPSLPADAPQPSGPASPTDTRSISVSGRLLYHDGLATIGADGVYFAVYDHDAIIPDKLLDSGITNSEGYYSSTFTWDDCWLCENPDIYVYFETNTSVVRVRSPYLISYHWETPTISNFSGTELDMGVFYPGSDEGALSISTNISRAWRWLKTHEQYSTPTVDVTWPSNVGNGAYYNAVTQTIHLFAGDEWHDVTTMHEYSHHWHNMYGNFSSPTYLDPGGGLFGHCMWCAENSLAAWEEGWADWLSVKIAQDLGYFPCDETEYTAICSGSEPYCDRCPEGTDEQKNDPYVTEGFVAALLRDIEDDRYDEDPLSGSGFADGLSLGTHEIFTVADQDAPTSVQSFFSAFKSRFPEYANALWRTGCNNSFQVDVLPPGKVTDLARYPLSALCLSGRGLATFNWSRADDDWSGVDGYSVLISGAEQLPDAVMDIGDVLNYATGCLPFGDYVFNIRSHDRSGKWSTEFASLHFSIISPRLTVWLSRRLRRDRLRGLASVDVSVQSADRMRVEIFDVSGRMCRSFGETPVLSGEFTLEWDGANDQGSKLPKGVYFARISSLVSGAQTTQRLVLVE